MEKQPTVINVNKFKPRSYQLPLLRAIENEGKKRALVIWPRRAGKDVTVLNLCIRACIRKPIICYYIFPTYSQAKKVIWDSLTNTGERILDYIPRELIESSNSQELKIRFKNDSLFQLVGSDNYDNLMGTNPQLCVFSEYALQDPRAYQFIRPILTANDGTAIFVSTPRGKNHLWELYNIALNHPDWFCEKLTVEDTCHIDLEDIDRDRASGEMSEDLIQQEYYTSFDMGVEGAYYAKYMDRMRIDGRIGMIPFETGFKVHTAWDIGVRDSTVIIFFQVIGRTVKIISAYDNTKEGLEHYIQYLQRVEIDRGYVYGKHFAPHDIAVTEWGSGVSRAEKARELGLKFELVRDNSSGKTRSVVPNVSIMDGIETVRSTFSKVWIDSKNCAKLIRALENYRQEFDPKKKVYKHFPLHDWSSHYADCMRYLCLVLPRIQMSNSSPEELDKRYQEAVYGNDHGGFFGHNPHGRN